ncbi:MAG: nucleotide sugar dehydrogenase [Prochlorococcus marinus CUG1431]|uniref:Nucleotide sugar dehydrogenase n=1 Tax=Prochlorococcus marinus CUG1433 TaxID=2774506 RepID=A0A9D9G2G3_PROMR|nr:nucleotide sugar dehydrogenase [Prochlorococcus marinus CUG1433]MBO6981261.1 nucleotide sugar dehydrogenase [Prochlorococcus marinus CUG1431]
MNRCCVVGLGYIGLPTAALFSKKGFNVLGVDINLDIVNKVNKGISPIQEPSLEDEIQNSVKSGNLKASSKPNYADIFVIAVPTPIKSGSKIPQPDLEYVETAIESIIPFLKNGNSIIIESTSPVGTTKDLFSLIIEKTDLNENQIFMAYCPERVLPGRIMIEISTNKRLIGGINHESSLQIKEIYKKICDSEIYITDSETAELVKLAENSYRDLNIAFANELSIISSKLDIDVNKVINFTNHHPRVNILRPSCGVGGHCIALDPWFLVSQFPEDTNIIHMSRKVNIFKTQWTISEISRFIEKIKNESKNDPKIGIFGLTFKANVNDLRESPALKIANELSKENHTIFCDPYVSNCSDFVNHSIEETLSNSDILIFLVAHSKFKKININEKKYLDFCGLFDEI